MHPRAVEPSRRSWLHARPAGPKLAGALILAAWVALLPRQLDVTYLPPAILVLSALFLAQLPFRWMLRRLLIAEFFILGVVLLSFLSPGGAALALSALVKSNLCVLAMLVLSGVTPFHEIVRVLRFCGLPSIMISTLALMERYLPVLAEESRRMERARRSRTFRPSNRLAWGYLSGIIAQLFIRATGRAERIYLAMCSRGWK
jgi:cobalt/nickel transport system permease protein